MGNFSITLPGKKIEFSVIQNTGSVSDGMGGIRENWEILFTVSDGIYSTKKLGNVEERREGKETVLTYHMFYAYYDASYELTEEMRIRFNGIDYDIVKIGNPAQANNHWEFRCREVETEF